MKTDPWLLVDRWVELDFGEVGWRKGKVTEWIAELKSYNVMFDDGQQPEQEQLPIQGSTQRSKQLKQRRLLTDEDAEMGDVVV